MIVLVVDDQPTVRKLLRAHMEDQAYEVREAADGVEALQLLAREPVDLIVSDLLMPRMDGYRLCHAVRHDAKLRMLPFLVFSSTYISDSDASLALYVGADRFFRKPDALHELLAAVRELAARGRSDQSPSAIPSELLVLKEYSEVLVRKLEKRNAALERMQSELQRANDSLEMRVRERTEQLEVANKELAAFGYAISHDLRTPLRHIACFGQLLAEECAACLDETARERLRGIIESTRRMQSMIEGLLKLSRLTNAELTRERVNLSALSADILRELQLAERQRRVEACIEPDLIVQGDENLLRIALENLLGNAWKFTARRAVARIEVGRHEAGAGSEFFIADNGAGFNTTYAGRLFELFRRAHTEQEFPGIGIGLVTVKRIIERHGGTIRAEGVQDGGATFSFTIRTPTGAPGSQPMLCVAARPHSDHPAKTVQANAASQSAG